MKTPQIGKWLRSGGLLYRLTEGRQPRNCDEILVRMADGSHDPALCEARAEELHKILEDVEAVVVAGEEALLVKAVTAYSDAWEKSFIAKNPFCAVELTTEDMEHIEAGFMAAFAAIRAHIANPE